MIVKLRARKWQPLIVVHALALFTTVRVATPGNAGLHERKFSEF
jgi:hypothetical protein